MGTLTKIIASSLDTGKALEDWGVAYVAPFTQPVFITGWKYHILEGTVL